MLKETNYKKILNEFGKEQEYTSLLNKEKNDLLKRSLFEMAMDLDERCKDNNLSLFLVGGTLLGAARNNSFIPWDDDFDFGLMRADYEKLKSLFDSVFSDDYEIRCPNTKHPNGNRFMQIYKKNTYLDIVGKSNELQPNMLSVDVFPYDYVPDNHVIRTIKGVIANIFMFVASCVMEQAYMKKQFDQLLKSGIGKPYLIIRMVTGKFFSFYKPEKWFDLVDSFIVGKHSNHVTSATGRKHYLGEILPLNAIVPFGEIEFEGHTFFAPNDINAYLSMLYGSDYIVPHDINERESHLIRDFIVFDGE